MLTTLLSRKDSGCFDAIRHSSVLMYARPVAKKPFCRMCCGDESTTQSYFDRLPFKFESIFLMSCANLVSSEREYLSPRPARQKKSCSSLLFAASGFFFA